MKKRTCPGKTGRMATLPNPFKYFRGKILLTRQTDYSTGKMGPGGGDTAINGFVNIFVNICMTPQGSTHIIYSPYIEESTTCLSRSHCIVECKGNQQRQRRTEHRQRTLGQSQD